MTRRTLAVIIGRAGSKGLPGKNARLLAGRPMVAHSIDDARAATLVDDLLVSTDCPDMTAAATALDVRVVPRPAALASDTATVDDAVRHAVDATTSDADDIVILYANVPVRPDDLIDRAVQRLRETGADSVQSYTGVGKAHPWWMVRLDGDGRVHAHHPNRVYRRQDLPPLFLPDGGVIAVTRASLFRIDPEEPHAFLGVDRAGIESPSGSVIDIDEAKDLQVAEAMLLEDAPAHEVTP